MPNLTASLGDPLRYSAIDQIPGWNTCVDAVGLTSELMELYGRLEKI